MTDQNSKVDKNNKKAEENQEDPKINEAKINKQAGEFKARIEELENQNKRLLADYRNLEKRMDTQRRDWILEANKKLLLNLLPILDTLILAEKYSRGDQTLSLSVKQFLDILKLEGIERIKTKGMGFDPNLMECIETVEVDPSASSGQEGKVIEEIRAGYTLYEKNLRPAQVKVGKGKASSN